MEEIIGWIVIISALIYASTLYSMTNALVIKRSLVIFITTILFGAYISGGIFFAVIVLSILFVIPAIASVGAYLISLLINRAVGESGAIVKMDIPGMYRLVLGNS
jgi:hypothetical protein